MDSKALNLLRYVAGIALFAAGYALLARAGFEIAPGVARVTPIWLPGALALAVLLLRGLHWWPGVLLGVLLFSLGLELSPAQLAASVTGHVASPVLGAWLLRRSDFNPTIRDFADGVRLLAYGAVLASAAGALVAGGVLLVSGHVASGELLPILQMWFMANTAGVLMLAPLLLAWAGHGVRAQWRERLPELALLVVLHLFACVTVFFWSSTAHGNLLPGYAIFPLVTWAALRFDQVVTGALVAVAALFAIVGSIQGYIPFDGYFAHILQLLSFIALLGAMGLLLSATRQQQLALAQEARALFNMEGAGIARTGLDGRFLEVNATLAGWLGYTPGELAGRHFTDITHPDDHATARQAQADLVSGRRHSAELLVRCRTRAGQDLWLRTTTALDHDADGRPRWCNSVLQDVSQEIAADTELRRQRDQLEQEVARRTADLRTANRELEAFSRSVSHDLRQPLSAFIGLAELVADQHGHQLDQNGREYLALLRESAESMNLLVESLLRLSLAQQAPLHRELLDVSAMAREVAMALATTARPASIEVMPGLAARGDASLVRIVLQNLLGNALKFSARTETPRIRVDQHVDADGTRWLLVADNGAGFDPQQSARLFQPFQRLHEAADYAGTGIGLATVQRIIERHGGEVRAEGAPGAGATFLFRLPE